MKTEALARFVENYGKGLALVSFAFALAGLAFAFRLPVSLSRRRISRASSFWSITASLRSISRC